MSSTRVVRRIQAPPSKVYAAIIDADSVAEWMVPTGMTSHVHEFDGREGGRFRISLTYEAPNQSGKTTAQTDTYHGRFVRLVENREVVQAVEFETDNPALRGEMTITMILAADDGGTEVLALHDHLPPAVSPADNELGWSMSLGKLAALVEKA